MSSAYNSEKDGECNATGFDNVWIKTNDIVVKTENVLEETPSLQSEENESTECQSEYCKSLLPEVSSELGDYFSFSKEENSAQQDTLENCTLNRNSKEKVKRPNTPLKYIDDKVNIKEEYADPLIDLMPTNISTKLTHHYLKFEEQSNHFTTDTLPEIFTGPCTLNFNQEETNLLSEAHCNTELCVREQSSESYDLSEDDFTLLKRKHTTRKLSSCNIPNKNCTPSGSYTNIKIPCSGESSFTRESCKESITEYGSVIQLKELSTSENSFRCTNCNKSFARSGLLTVHMRVHTGEKPFICDVCNKRFVQSGDLRRHRRVHTGEQPFSCDICKTSFTYSSNLKRHSRTVHEGEKLFNCDICKKSFTAKGGLRKHRIIHTGEKSFNCDICNKSFVRSGHLTRHRIIHTDEKPFSCAICNKSFNYAGNLSTHLRIHKGKKTFSCGICNKSFTDSTYLYKHKRRMHK